MRQSMLILLASISPSFGEEPASRKKASHYVIFPVTTQLQQKELLSPKQRYHVFLNGDTIFDKEGRILPAQFTPSQLSEDLRNAESARQEDTISFVTLCARYPGVEAIGFLNLALEGWARGRHFEKPRAWTSSSNTDQWKPLMEITKGRTGLVDDEAIEDGVGDKLIHAYPIRTPLSRYLALGADCFVAIRRPLDNDYDALDAATKKAIASAVGKLKLEKRAQVTFSISYTKEGNEAGKRFLESGAKTLAKDLGFVEWSVRTTQ